MESLKESITEKIIIEPYLKNELRKAENKVFELEKKLKESEQINKIEKDKLIEESYTFRTQKSNLEEEVDFVFQYFYNLYERIERKFSMEKFQLNKSTNSALEKLGIIKQRCEIVSGWIVELNNQVIFYCILH
jgi:hypothetical protein